MRPPSPPPLDTLRFLIEDPEAALIPASWGRYLLGALAERDRSITRLEAEVERLGLENMALRKGQHS